MISYSDSEKKQGPLSPEGIVWQDTSGEWYRVKTSAFDTLRGMVTASISHFTNYTRQLNYSVEPATADLHVGASRQFLFHLGDWLPDKYTDAIDEEELSYEAAVKLIPRSSITWYVNGIAGGNELFGYIDQDGNNPLKAKYTAPALVPVNDPVRIEARLAGVFTVGSGRTINGASGFASVTIYDDYRYTFIGYDDMGGVFHMIDSSSCQIRVSGKYVSMSDIQNYVPWSDWPKKSGECSYTYPDKDSWVGLVEISGMGSGTASSDGSGPNGDIDNEEVTHVHINLAPAFGNTPSFIEKCTRHESYVPRNRFPAQPTTIDFSRRQGGITIRYMGLEGVNELSHIHNGEGWVIRVLHD